jgi:hypothetical protein
MGWRGAGLLSAGQERARDLQGPELFHPARRGDGAGRAVGGGQVVASAHRRAAGGAECRRGVRGGAQLHRAQRCGAHPHPAFRHRLRVPVPPSAAGVLGSRQRGHSAAHRRGVAGGRRRRGRACCWSGWAWGAARALAVGTVGRRAAARGHRAGAGQQADAAAGRRADRQPRSRGRPKRCTASSCSSSRPKGWRCSSPRTIRARQPHAPDRAAGRRPAGGGARRKPGA